MNKSTKDKFFLFEHKIEDKKINNKESISYVFNKESKYSNNVDKDISKMLINKNKTKKYISKINNIYSHIINFLIFEYIIFLSLPKTVFSLLENNIVLYIDEIGDQQIFSDEYDINQYYPLRIYVNGVFQILREKKVLIDKVNSKVEIEWTHTHPDLSYMFANLAHITSASLNNMLNSTNSNLNYMFYNCKNLIKFAFNGAKTNFEIIDTTKMFYNCISLTSVSFDNYKANNINISYMFYNNYNLNLVKFVKPILGNDMREIFYNCSSLYSLVFNSLKSINDNNINTSYSFYNCSNITNIIINGPIITNDMRYMFYNCEKLVNITLNFLKISASTNMSYSFYNCQKLTSYIWNNELNTPADMRNMFYNCSTITSINLPNLKTISNINMTRMFFNCIELKTITFNTNSRYYPNDMHALFYNCLSLKNLDLENIIDASNTIDMSYLFYNCSKLETLKIKFNNQLTNNIRGIFQNCKSLVTLDLTQFYTKNVEIMWDMFNGCSGLISLNIDFSKFDTSKVTDMESMFEGCSSLTSLSLDSLKTQNVQYMNKMFRNCVSLKTLDFKKINTNSVGTMHQMFYNCSSLEYLNLFSIEERGQSVLEMFSEASNNFTFCIKENENIPNIFETLLNIKDTVRDCTEVCYDVGNERVNISEKKLCCRSYTFENNCYDKCPSKTKVGNKPKHCESFTCDNENEYYNYEQSDCTTDIKGYYVNDSIAKTIDKCHDDCIECKGGWSNETTNCTKCTNEKKYIYLGNCYKNCSPGYYDNEQTICKCFNRKCKLCSENSLEYELCESCNDEYYPKENDPTNKSNWINCYHEPENYYLDNGKYKQCYESCKYCTTKGDYDKQYCTICNTNNSFGILMEDSDDSLYNCYPNCSYYYYFDNNIYNCTIEDKCPDDYSKLIHGDRRCVKSCIDTKKTKYEFRGECYEFCPPDKSYNNSITDYFCKITCPFEEPFEMVYEQVCRANCTIEQRDKKECRTNYHGNRTNEEIQDKVLENIKDDIIDTFNYNQINETNSIILKEINHTYEIMTTNKKSTYGNTSGINMDKCIKTLKTYYNIPDYESLYILKVDAIRDGIQSAKVGFLVYYPLNNIKLEELDLALCSGDTVSIFFQANLTKDQVMKYNLKSAYYNDICFSYTTEDGIDIPIQARKDESIENEDSFCADGCDFDYDTGQVECKCPMKNTGISSLSDLKIDKDTLYKFVDIKNLINFNVMKCYRLLLNGDELVSNIGFYIFMPTILMYFICLIIFIAKEYTLIKKQINEIIEAKRLLKKLLEKGKILEEIIHSKFENPVFLKILRFKGMKVSNKFNYADNTDNKKSEDIKNNFLININQNKKKKKKTEMKEIKEEIDQENDIIYNNKSKIKQIKIDKNAGLKRKFKNAPPFKNGKLVKEKLDVPVSRDSKKDILLENGIRGNKIGTINYDIIDKLDGDAKEKEKVKTCLNYNDNELNRMTYQEALRLDKRTFFESYLSLLKSKHMLISLFERRDYNSRIIKIYLIFYNFSSCYAINGLFFDDDTMVNIYRNKGEYNFISQLPQIVYSTIISYIIENLFNFLALTEDDIIGLKQEKIIASIGRKGYEVLKIIEIKLILFFVLGFLTVMLYWYYIACFCAVYKNTQYHLMKDTLISFATSFGTPFLIYLIPPIIRACSLKKKTKTNEFLYGFSKLFQVI